MCLEEIVAVDVWPWILASFEHPSSGVQNGVWILNQFLIMCTVISVQAPRHDILNAIT